MISFLSVFYCLYNGVKYKICFLFHQFFEIVYTINLILYNFDKSLITEDLKLLLKKMIKSITIKESKNNQDTEKEDENMTTLAQYLESNRKKAYDSAIKNTKYVNNRPVISKDDEWLEETEWDDLFEIMKKQSEK